MRVSRCPAAGSGGKCRVRTVRVTSEHDPIAVNGRGDVGRNDPAGTEDHVEQQVGVSDAVNISLVRASVFWPVNQSTNESPGWSLDTTIAPRAASASHNIAATKRMPVLPWENSTSGKGPGCGGASGCAAAEANPTPGNNS